MASARCRRAAPGQVAIGMAIAFACVLASAAQQPRFRAAAREVLVPVSVVDNAGHDVLGLKRGDLRLFFDGRAVALSGFAAMAPPPAGRAGVPPTAPLPRGVFVNLPAGAASRRARVVLLLDYLNTTTVERQRLRGQLARFLAAHSHGSADIAIYGMTDALLLLQPFSDDPKVLAAAAAELLAAKPGRGQPGLPPPSVVGAATMEPLSPAERVQYGMRVAAGQGPSPRAGGGTDQAIEYLLAQEEWLTSNLNRLVRARDTLDEFKDLARALRGIPGRKEVLWLTSDASPLNPTLIYQLSLDEPEMSPLRVPTADVASAYRLLAAADVALFPVDVRGVNNPGLLGAGAQASHTTFKVMMGQAAPGADASSGFADSAESEAANSSLAMTGAAAATGGEVLANNNDLGVLLARAASLWSSYYLLTAAAPPAAPGYHKIAVKVDRKGVKLLYRRGFTTESPAATAAPKVRESDLRQAAHALLDATAIPIVLYLGPPHRVGKGAELPFTATFWGPSLGSERLPRGIRFFLTTATVTISAGGKIVASAGRDLDRILSAQQAAQVAARGYTIAGKFVIPGSGQFYGRLIVRDNLSGRLGTITLRLP